MQNQILEQLAALDLGLIEVAEEIKEGHLFMTLTVNKIAPLKSIQITLRPEPTLAQTLAMDQMLALPPDSGFVDHEDYTPPGNTKLVQDADDARL